LKSLFRRNRGEIIGSTVMSSDWLKKFSAWMIYVTPQVNPRNEKVTYQKPKKT